MNKILIIEDDQIVANIYRNKLSVEGYQVELASDGQTGLDMVSSFRPDVVLLDLMLPKLTGVDLMKKVRAQPGFEKLPIIVFSNTYLSNIVQEAWKAGATKCLSKANCTPKQVIEVLRSTLPGNKPATGSRVTATSPVVASQTTNAAQQSAPAGKSAAEMDKEFQTALHKSFVESLPATLATLRTLLQTLIKSENEETRVKHLQELYRRIHALTGNAGLAGINQIAQMADALEALLKELHEKPKSINASTLRTVAYTIDFLGVLFEHGQNSGSHDVRPAKILVVDDEVLSRRAITYALDKAKLESVNLEDPLAAFKLLSEAKFDLIFLDVDMPGMNGFELCTKLRGLPGYKKTPVVFVTSLNDFDARANSTMAGANDFIAKPFLFIELAVKALTYVLRGRMEAAKPGGGGGGLSLPAFARIIAE